MLRPSVAVRSTSENTQASFWPSLQPRRGEGPDVLDDLLLDVQPKAILVAIGARRFDVGGADGAVERVLVAAHVGSS